MKNLEQEIKLIVGGDNTSRFDSDCGWDMKKYDESYPDRAPHRIVVYTLADQDRRRRVFEQVALKTLAPSDRCGWDWNANGVVEPIAEQILSAADAFAVKDKP